MSLLGGLLLTLMGCTASPPADEHDPATPRFSVLVFSEIDADGYRHSSTPDGIRALRSLGKRHYFGVDVADAPAVFTSDSLQLYDAVVFLNTSGDVLDDAQQDAFERYIRGGGGFVGIHGAAATEYDWSWYGGLVGAFAEDHSGVQEATVQIATSSHPSTLHLPTPWTRTDSWYNFRTNPSDSVDVLLRVDESSYDGGAAEANHPIAWLHEYDGGRSFYTGLGHTEESFSAPNVRRHLLKGMEWAAGKVAPFVEPEFPFITTTVDASGLTGFMPEKNVAVRGLALQLGNGAYASFDPDLLRMSAGWTGDFVSMSTMAQVSYDRPHYKSDEIPQVLGSPIFGTGMYPGWARGSPTFEDPRPPGPNPDDPGRGPLPAERGQWNGVYVVDDKAILSYTIRGVEVREHPSSMLAGDAVGITRTFEVDPRDEPLTLVASEVEEAGGVTVDSSVATLSLGTTSDSVAAIGGVHLPEGADLRVIDDQYATLRLPESTETARFRLVLWTGPRSQLSRFREMLSGPVSMPSVEEGSEYWTRAVHTRGRVAPDTSAFVTDELSLPRPNPWDRNVRVADVDFFDDGRAAVVTFSGDVWLLSGIDQDLEQLHWERYASGLFEPLSLSIVDGDIYVYGREGIVRLRDLDADGEAEFYENYTRRIVQSMETREWPLDMVERPEGGFYASMGAALVFGPRTEASKKAARGFRVGSHHAGTVVEVTAGGDSVDVYADGLREAYLGTHPPSRFLTASDQQGHFVPSTPIYALREGEYYGVPATAHQSNPLPEPESPLTWIPHKADPSGASQLWVNSDQMGPLNNELLHFSYSRPGPFRIYADTTTSPWQGGVKPFNGDYNVPTVKGMVHPIDGQVYFGGFQIWGTRAEKISSLLRLRHTGQTSEQPARLRAGKQGIVLRFDRPLDSTAASMSESYTIRRWNYKRTRKYGSGRFKPDGSPGEEVLPVADAHLSEDGRAVLLVVPDMKPVMQLKVDYSITASDGTPLNGPVYLTLNEARPIDLEQQGFEKINWTQTLQTTDLSRTASPAESTKVVSVTRGRHIYQETGCATCHSLDGSREVGPSFRGLYGTERALKNGDTVVADEEYLRQSILSPTRHVVKDYKANMPSYQGVLNDSEIESMIRFMKSLNE